MGLVESRSLSEQANDLLVDWIVSARLKPGMRLRENELAEELGISRTPIREALKKLAGLGIVTMVPRRGAYVGEIDDRKLEEILDLRYILEMYAAERGVKRISQDGLRDMRSSVEECESVLDGADPSEYLRFIEADSGLHRLIIETSGNDVLRALYERLAVFLQIARVRFSQPTRDMARGYEEHRAVLRAYEERDEDRLLQALGEHLTRARNEILEASRGHVGAEGGSTRMTSVSRAGEK